MKKFSYSEVKTLRLFQNHFQEDLSEYIAVTFCKNFFVGLLPVSNTLDKNLLNVSYKQSCKTMHTADTYLEPTETSKMENFVKIVKGF